MTDATLAELCQRLRTLHEAAMASIGMLSFLDDHERYACVEFYRAAYAALPTLLAAIERAEAAVMVVDALEAYEEDRCNWRSVYEALKLYQDYRAARDAEVTA